ncbi:DNA polymerase III subunit alpha [Pectinatus brassicae]|uniref:DNA polymerase III subunit alpha n=1 Tax=Pectinatus brassicae TaxID=862415 RepID=A0A840UUD8_9FIRM|nr:DNA polymerase III subunit alpha [Pectinatus brassicae]MBB5336075.1 DNA polymerase-3 subunit alpha [Pectinatus brassicae]
MTTIENPDNTRENNNLHSSFVHLHVHTQYSLLDGASRIKNLVAEAKAMNMPAVAITDHGNMYGAVEFYKAAKAEGIKPIIGCEVYVAPRDRHENFEINGVRYYHLILLAENELGYKNLVKLVSLANIEGMYYKPRVDKEILQEYHEGIIALSACVAGEIPQAILHDDAEKTEKVLQEYLAIFGKDNFFLEIQNHNLPEEIKANKVLIELAHKHDIGLIATNDIHYLKKQDSEFHDVLLCIQTGKTLNDSERMKFSSDDYYLKSAEEMKSLFSSTPEAITNSLKIAARCNVDFEFGHLHLPYFPLPDGMTDQQYLRNLCEDNLNKRYKEITEEIRERLEYELKIIHKMGYDSYFLIVWDFINFSRENDIVVGPGRGSAAGSIVAYLLRITDIDPLAYELLFERFLNPERVTMPDIDIDFCYIRREEVIEYVKRRYGEDHVAQIITFGTMAARGALRDVGRVMDIPYNDVDKIAKMVPTDLGMTLDKALKESKEFRSAYENDATIHRMIDFARDIEGMPRHSSTHAAGVVIARQPLTDYLPVQTSEGTLVTQYDKDYVEELGLLKMDFLGLRTLTVISNAIKNIKNNTGNIIDISSIPLDDEKTAKMLCSGDTCGVFQMESSGMTTLVKDLQPKEFADLIPLVALYRPGPLGSGMVTDFINGRHGKSKVSYMHPLLEPILKETFGVVLYQEQVMQIVQVLAGFTLGQADILRRAMGKKKHAVLVAQKENFIKGTREKNIDDKLAEKIFDLLVSFADYGFNKSHSAAYALVAYQTAYLKAHYPQEYMAAMLTSFMTNADKIKNYIEQCQYMGIKILPPDINLSGAAFTADAKEKGIRFGLAAIKNVGESAMDEIIAIRQQDGAFKSLVDFCSRVDSRIVNKRGLEYLIRAGAFDSLGNKRSQLLAVMDQVIETASMKQKDIASGQLSLFGEAPAQDEIKLPDIPELSRMEMLSSEKEITGFYITGHPLDLYREKLGGTKSLAQLTEEKVRDNSYTKIAGVIVGVKKMNTRKGDTMCILQVEDFTQTVEVVVFPNVFYESVNIIMPEEAIMISGTVNLQDNGFKIIARQIKSLSNYKQTYWIQINAMQEKPDFLEKLKDILVQHHGDYVVCFYFLTDKKKIKTQPQYWIDGSEQAVAAIKELVGAEAVKTT